MGGDYYDREVGVADGYTFSESALKAFSNT